MGSVSKVSSQIPHQHSNQVVISSKSQLKFHSLNVYEIAECLWQTQKADTETILGVISLYCVPICVIFVLLYPIIYPIIYPLPYYCVALPYFYPIIVLLYPIFVLPYPMPPCYRVSRKPLPDPACRKPLPPTFENPCQKSTSANCVDQFYYSNV